MGADKMPRAALVTGAAQRIGRAIATSLAEDGWAVAVHYRSSRKAAESLVAEIAEKGGKAVAIQASVAKSIEVKRLFAETKAKLGAPSILVNNAGVFAFGPIEAVTGSAALEGPFTTAKPEKPAAAGCASQQFRYARLALKNERF